jgi:hypothetical protein
MLSGTIILRQMLLNIQNRAQCRSLVLAVGPLNPNSLQLDLINNNNNNNNNNSAGGCAADIYIDRYLI